MGARSVLILAELSDDERLVVEQDCENCNFEVKWVSSPEMVGTKLISGKFDALVVDLRTPGAARACVEARKALARVRFPIMAMEDEANDTTFTKAFRVGADDVIQMSASAQISQRLAAIPKPSWKRPERSRGEALIIDPDKNRAEALARLLKEAGYLVKSVRDEAASRIHRGRESVRLVVAEAGNGTTKLIRDGNRREWQPIWIVRARPDQLDAASRDLAAFHNASAVNGYLSPADVLCEANRLAEAALELANTLPLLLHGTRVSFSAEDGKWSDRGFSYSLGLDTLAVRTLALPPGADLALELVPPGDDQPIRLRGEVTERRVFGPLQGRSAPPGFSVQLSGEALPRWQALIQAAYQRRHGRELPESLPASSTPVSEPASSPAAADRGAQDKATSGHVKLTAGGRRSSGENPPATLLGGIGIGTGTGSPAPKSDEASLGREPQVTPPPSRALAGDSPSSDDLASVAVESEPLAEPAPMRDLADTRVSSDVQRKKASAEAVLEAGLPEAEDSTPVAETARSADANEPSVNAITEATEDSATEPDTVAATPVSKTLASSRRPTASDLPEASDAEARGPASASDLPIASEAPDAGALTTGGDPPASGRLPVTSGPLGREGAPGGADSPAAVAAEEAAAANTRKDSPDGSAPHQAAEPGAPEHDTRPALQAPKAVAARGNHGSARSPARGAGAPESSRTPSRHVKRSSRMAPLAIVAALAAGAVGVALTSQRPPRSPLAARSASHLETATPRVHALSSSPRAEDAPERPPPASGTKNRGSEAPAGEPSQEHSDAAPTVDPKPGSKAASSPIPAPSNLDPAGLAGHQAYLYVDSPLDTQVFVQGKLVGKTNSYLETFCGRRYIRLGSAPGHWQSRGVTFKIACQKHNRLTLKPRPAKAE